jgi:protein SCO1/2
MKLPWSASTPLLAGVWLMCSLAWAGENPGPAPAGGPQNAGHPLLDTAFTNQLGQIVRLSDFKGQALAVTFLFTRCPNPNYCPRLAKNFENAATTLLALPGAPTNWHFFSVSFDPEFDTPPVLKAYAERYHCDPARWSFLTGPVGKVRELATLSDVQFAREGELFSHNFRTLIIDANGRLQMSFPIGGDLSDALVEQMIKAARPAAIGP